MIGKVTRGTNVRRLLYYLYGPGKANEHTDPRLVAGFGDPAELEPDRLRRRVPGLPAADWPTEPAAGGAERGQLRQAGVALRAAGRAGRPDAVGRGVGPGRGARSWTGPGWRRTGTTVGVRWVAVRHAADHIHLVATLARQDRHRPDLWNSYRKLRRACRDSRGMVRAAAHRRRRIAPPRSGTAGPSRSRRSAAGGTSRRGPGCAGRCAPRQPGRAPRKSSSPIWGGRGCWCAAATAPSALAR